MSDKQKPDAVYIALRTEGVDEPDHGYTRRAVGHETFGEGPPATQGKLNITFPAVSADWGTMRCIAIAPATGGGPGLILDPETGEMVPHVFSAPSDEDDSEEP